MASVAIVERSITEAELQWVQEGFRQHARDLGVAVQDAERFGFVAEVDGRIIGRASGLAYRDDGVFTGWFYLTDLFVEKRWRGQGLGAALLNQLEQRVQAEGVDRFWVWTAGYEAPGFYQKQGYEIFAELENWYSNGANRVALRKQIYSHKWRNECGTF